jgi:hypothetical protein
MSIPEPLWRPHPHRGSDLERGSISSTQLADSSVTSAKILNGTIVTADIADATITAAKLASEAWTDFTPDLDQGGAVTKTVSYCRYVRAGRTITYQGRLIVTGTGNATTAVLITLPVTAVHAAFRAIGVGDLFNSSAGTKFMCEAQLNNSTTVVRFQPMSETDNSILGASGPFTSAIAADDALTFSIVYEAAS